MTNAGGQVATAGAERSPMVSAWLPNRKVQVPRWVMLAGALAAQIFVSFVIDQVRSVALVQAAVILGVGIYGLLKRDLSLVICVIAYLSGAEIVWRQVTAPVYYQTAPYMVIVLSAFAVVVLLGRVNHTGRLALLYMALLLPAAITTIATAGSGARALIAFALSGPIVLALLTSFTSQLRVQRWLYHRILWVLVVSAFGPLTVAVVHLNQTLAVRSVNFSTQSNFDTSGGFGPVQVSSMLGLGVLAALILALHERQQMVRLVACGAALALAIQSLLTFSRGGMYSVAFAAGVLIIGEVRSPRARIRAVVLVVATLALGYYVVVPRLDTFTNGVFATRFSDTSSGRTSLASNDLQIFRKHLTLGVGPGMTKFQRVSFDDCKLRSDLCANEASSHTEFTRMLGEHGLPGLGAIVVLGALIVRAVRGDPRHRTLVATLLTWAVAQMFYANLRLAAVPIVFGLAFLRIAEPEDPVDEPVDEPPRSGRARVVTAW